jgi:CheY-like chemotaxis protein
MPVERTGTPPVVRLWPASTFRQSGRASIARRASEDMSVCHILVVEDEAISAQALEDVLTREGYRVSLAADGQEGLEMMSREPADAIVTDLRMPRLNGQDMIRRLWALGINRPIIVMTGYAAFAHSNGLAESGDAPVVILQKPINFDEIVRSLRQLVDTQSC